MQSEKQQLNFDDIWANSESVRRERYALLMSALRAVRADEKIRGLVILVYNMQQSKEGKPLAWTVEEIGSEFGDRSGRTIRRWIQRAVDAGLIACDEHRYDRKGGQGANSLSINWDGVRDIACSPERVGQRSTDCDARQGAKLSGRPDSLGAKVSGRPDIMSGPNKEILFVSNSTTPTSWEVVEEELRRFGVNQWQSAIEDARNGEFTPDQVRELLAYARRNREGWPDPGRSMRRRLERESSLPIGEGWEAFVDGYQPARQPQENAQRVERERLEELHEELERAVGSEFDALSRQDQTVIYQSLPQDQRGLSRRYQRLAALEHFANCRSESR